MRYDNPELLRQLAAEYVIGTLQGAARKRFETLVEVNEEARFQRDFWEQRLAEFGQALHPVAPPAEARAALLQRTAAPAALEPVVRRPRLRRRRRALWTYAAGFATAAALAAAFLLGQQHPAAPVPSVPLALQLPATTVDEAGTIYAAQVQMPASRMGWLLSITPDHEQLIAVAGEDFLQIGRHRLHLWCVAPGSAPVSLGDLPNERDTSAAFRIPASLRGTEQVTFIVTLEPLRAPDGSGPAGPVLNEARALNGI